MGVSLEDVPAEVYTVLLPIAGVGVVAITVLVFFWLGSGRQRSYEDAVTQAKKKADEVLKDKDHQSPRSSKKKRAFPRKNMKKADNWEDVTEESNPPGGALQPVKSILKPVVTAVAPTPERSPRNRVEFHLETLPPKDEEASASKTPRSPPTPHPAKTASFLSSTDSPLPHLPSLNDSPEASTPEPVKSAPEEPKKKAAPTSKSSGGQKKSKAKSKHTPESLDGVEALPISRLSDIMSASSMSDEDIQVLLELLFDKLSTNAEWEAASLRSESAKTLKKHNTELQKRYEEAQRTVLAHSGKIKDLRSEIQLEKSRHVSAENNLQGKISQQVNELQISKARVSGLELELKQVKSTQNTKQLQEENLQLREQIGTVAQQSSALTSQVAVQGKQLQDLQDNVVAGLKSKLQRAEEALRSAEASAASAGRVTELEALLAASEGEKQQLQISMQSMNEEKQRATVDIDLLTATKTQRDQLQGQADDLAGKLQDAETERDQLQDRTDDLAGKLQDAETERDQLQDRTDDLAGKLQDAETQRDQLQDRTDDLASKLQDAETALDNLRDEIQHSHESATDERAKTLEGQNTGSQSEVDRLHQRLKDTEDHADTVKQEELAALSENLAREARATQDRYEAEIASLKDSMTVLEKRDQQLQCDLETLKAASNSPPQQNGDTAIIAAPAPVEDKAAKGSEEDGEVARLTAEKNELSDEYSTLQKKLDELKIKNNTLRDSCWKARDEAASKEKAYEQKLKQTYREGEQRCKASKSESLRDAAETHKAFLQQLFPEVEVTGEGVTGEGVSGGGFSQWLDEFESQARDILERNRAEVCALQEKLVELQGSEHAAIEGVEQLQGSLKETMKFLGELQSKVDLQTAENRQTVSEKDEMIERERFSNRALQEQLLKENETTEQLRQNLESAVDGSAEGREQLAELQERLTEVEHHRQLAENEAETLRHSLKLELEMKENTQEKLEELNEKEEELEDQKNKELVQEVEVLQQKLAESEKRLEGIKLSNRELNAKLSEIMPSSATSSDV